MRAPSLWDDALSSQAASQQSETCSAQGYRDDDYLLNLFRSCPLVAISAPAGALKFRLQGLRSEQECGGMDVGAATLVFDIEWRVAPGSHESNVAKL